MISHTRKSDNTVNTGFCCLRKTVPFVFLLLFLHPGLFAGNEAAAQQALRSPSNTQNETEETKSDFLFHQSTGYLEIRIGEFFPTADSDIFKMVTSELTLKKSDFRASNVGIDAGFSLYERVDLVFSLDDTERTRKSEFRDYVDEQGLPITQTTYYSQQMVTAGIKYLFVPRGRQVGHYAYLPSRIVPFVSAGGGLIWYNFKQYGDFVDSSTLEIFPAILESSGTAPTLYLGGGTDIRLFRASYLTLDLRYSWAKNDMEGDFVGFDPIDLSGLRLTAGLQWRF
jgi:hypothetical protein